MLLKLCAFKLVHNSKRGRRKTFPSFEIQYILVTNVSKIVIIGYFFLLIRESDIFYASNGKDIKVAYY